jgi:ClpP class serine protease
MDIFSQIDNTPWAITKAGLNQIVEIASRQSLLTPEAVSTLRGKPLADTRKVEMRGDVAVIPITGSIFRYANLFADISGATSVSMIGTDFGRAMDDNSVRAAVLNYDTPGGEVAGIHELSDIFVESRGRKPVIAYIGGDGASAGYWLASGASEIVAGKGSIIGSVGVVAAYTDTTARDAKSDVRKVEIVSSQSPLKRLDPSSDAGTASLQAWVDEIAQGMIESIAANRGVSVNKVLADFGRGEVMTGKKAVAAGMADRIGSFEGVIKALQAKTSKTITFGALSAAKTAPKGGQIAMTEEERIAAEQKAAADKIHADALLKAAADSAAKAGLDAKTRIAAIIGSPEAKGREATAQSLAL